MSYNLSLRTPAPPPGGDPTNYCNRRESCTLRDQTALKLFGTVFVWRLISVPTSVVCLNEQRHLVCSIGRQHWEAALVCSIGVHHWEAALGGSIGVQHWCASLGGSIGRQHWEAALGGSIGMQHWCASLGGSIGRQHWCAALVCIIGRQLI